MIKKLSFISVFILLFSAAGVSAQETEERSSSAGSNGLDQRVTERLRRLTVDLDDNQLQALRARCQAAQDKLKEVKKAATAYSLNQNENIDGILDDLATLGENLKSQGIDAGSIDKKIEEINQLRTRINSTYEDYLQAVDDSVAIDCQTSPEGFRLSIDDAKQRFSNLREQRASLITLIKVDLRQDLTDIKDSL